MAEAGLKEMMEEQQHEEDSQQLLPDEDLVGDEKMEGGEEDVEDGQPGRRKSPSVSATARKTRLSHLLSSNGGQISKPRIMSKKLQSLCLEYPEEGPSGYYSLLKFMQDEACIFNKKPFEQTRQALDGGFFQKDTWELIKGIQNERLTEVKLISKYRNHIHNLGSLGTKLYDDWVDQQLQEDEKLQQRNHSENDQLYSTSKASWKNRNRDPLQCPEFCLILGDGCVVSWDRGIFPNHITISKCRKPDPTDAEKRQGVWSKPLDKFQVRVPLASLDAAVASLVTLKHYIERLSTVRLPDYIRQKEQDRQNDNVNKHKQAEFDYSFRAKQQADPRVQRTHY